MSASSTSPSPASRGLLARDLALIAVFAALLAVLGQIPAFPLFAAVAPVTAQTLGVMLAGSLLGARRGALAVTTFLALVAAGLPLLSGGRGGPAVFVGRSAGFLLGWVLGAYVIGYLVERRPARGLLGWLVMANVVGGMGVVYALGIPAMALLGDLSILKATALSAVYLPGDLAKVAVACVVTAGVLRGYPGITRSRRSPQHVGAGR